MRKVAEKLGMKEEGRFREGMFLNGKFVDIINYGLIKKDTK
jgi:RimJ/RimL family protein N-acetyltransferase